MRAFLLKWLGTILKCIGSFIAIILLIRLYKKNRHYFLIGAAGAFLIAVACCALHLPDKIFYTALPLWAIIATYLPDLFGRK